MKRCLRTICFATLMASGALAQQKKSEPPPPKPQDAGPSLEVTMKFIQDKMNDQGTVGYVVTRNNGLVFRTYYLISDVVADASTCTLRAKKKTTTQIEVPDGYTYTEDGKAVSGDDLHREGVEAITSPFKDADTLVVESAQDAWNRGLAEAARPEVTVTFTPAVYSLTLRATKNVFVHEVFTKGKVPPYNKDDMTGKKNTFMFRDEETANRVAKAMQHAVELCGGGNKPEPF
jgi:hypothetical protein